MKKLVIPAILAATVLVAGAFAFMPVEKASTVHTTILAGTSQIVTLAPATALITPAAGGDATDRTSCTKTSTTPFRVLGITLTTVTDANTNLDLAAFADGEVSTNLQDDPGTDITTVTAVGTADDNFAYFGVNTLVSLPLVGTTNVAFGPLADATAGDAVDTVQVTFILQVSGSDSAASFTCALS